MTVGLPTVETQPVLLRELLDALEGTCYLVSREGLLLAYGQSHWDRFAWENGAPELTRPERVLGRPLADFISGERERQAQALMVETLLRRTRSSVSYNYQCDAPEYRRPMRMYISPVLRDRDVVALCYQTRSLGEAPRPPVGLLAAPLESAAERPLLATCSYCKRVRFPPGAEEGEWLTPEQYYARGGSEWVRLSHGICPGCYETVVEPLYAELTTP